MLTRTQTVNPQAAFPPVSVAPMMERTDRHFRYLARIISPHTLLYTEMLTPRAIIHGDRDHLLGFHESEHPISLQLGGDNPEEMAQAIKLAAPYGYDELNLNIGCPSERVQTGNFGACLMATPIHVARLVDAMRGATTKEVTVKHRIGINGRDSYDELCEFVETVAAAGCRRFSVHARIAILGGLSPKENRSIPPLSYETVYRLKRDYPHLDIEINGGIREVGDVLHHLQHVDAVMIGRAAYDHPYLLAEVEQAVFGNPHAPTRREVVERMLEYIDIWKQTPVSSHTLVRHMLGLFAFKPGTRRWKQHVSELLPRAEDPSDAVRAALATVPAAVLDERLPIPELATAEGE
ncbi:MAG: tRNA dihydrouridine(20/20a) synthase DusA [Spirochaeta sp.]|nr:tRNA dihydrouridine(20/20a) synthase DusA [Spirochaeta sp.]